MCNKRKVCRPVELCAILEDGGIVGLDVKSQFTVWQDSFLLLLLFFFFLLSSSVSSWWRVSSVQPHCYAVPELCEDGRACVVPLGGGS